MGYSVRSGSSSVESLHEEDPNIPSHVSHVPRGEIGGECSVCSEVSDFTMRQYGLKYDFKPDIGEIANMTLHVNYGDLANMASEKRPSMRSLVLDPVFSSDDDAEVTWSQLLDHEALPRTVREEQSSKSYLWTKGHNEPQSSWATLVPPSPFQMAIQRTQHSRRPSDTFASASLSSFRRPRPLTAIKRLLLSRKKNSNDHQENLASDVIRGGSIPSTVFVR